MAVLPLLHFSFARLGLYVRGVMYPVTVWWFLGMPFINNCGIDTAGNLLRVSWIERNLVKSSPT
jgi:hypothetical protein